MSLSKDSLSSIRTCYATVSVGTPKHNLEDKLKAPGLRDIGFRLAGRSGRLEKGLKRYKAMALDVFGRMWLEGLAADMLLFLWCSGHVS